jgi:hypothetical protein
LSIFQSDFADLVVSTLILGAWDPQLEAEASVRLPNRARSLSAHHQRVGIITTMGEALVWEVGGGLKLLDTSALRGTLDSFSRWDTCCVLFHPVSQHCALSHLKAGAPLLLLSSTDLLSTSHAVLIMD